MQNYMNNKYTVYAFFFNKLDYINIMLIFFKESIKFYLFFKNLK